MGLSFHGATVLLLITTRNRWAADNPPSAPGRRELSPNPRTMTDRDNNVYHAKLAEQAERYDGKAWMSRGVSTAECPVPFFPLQSSCAGGSETQVNRFTWICWARDKMAEFSPAEWLSGRLNNSFLGANGSAFYLTGRSPCGVLRCLVYGPASRLLGGRSCSPDGVNLLAYTR